MLLRQILAILGLLATFLQAAPPPEVGIKSGADDLAGAIQRQVANREALQTKSTEAQDALRKWYESALDAVKKDALGKGDLDSVLATDAERGRMDRDLTIDEAGKLPKIPRAVRDKYDGARVQQAIQLKTALTTSLLAYATSLEALEKRLTQQGNLDGAIATRTERAKVAAQLAAPDAPPASVVAANVEPSAPPTPPAPATPEPPKVASKTAPASGGAATIKEVSKENPGQVEVDGLIPVKLEATETATPQTWLSVTPDLAGATIFVGNSKTGPASIGVAAYKALAPGRVYLALNYAYQGNRSGNWTGDRWMEEDFVKNGWTHVEGPEIVSHYNGNRKFVIYTKVLEKDETGHLRCNKYEPPYFITFHP